MNITVKNIPLVFLHRVPVQDNIDRDNSIPPVQEEDLSPERSDPESVYRDPDFDRVCSCRSSYSNQWNRPRYIFLGNLDLEILLLQ